MGASEDALSLPDKFLLWAVKTHLYLLERYILPLYSEITFLLFKCWVEARVPPEFFLCYSGITVGYFVTAIAICTFFHYCSALCFIVLLSFLVLLVSRLGILCGLSRFGILVDGQHLGNSFSGHFSWEEKPRLFTTASLEKKKRKRPIACLSA